MSSDGRGTITLVGLRQAKKGFSFLHEGPLKECEGCEVFRVCMKSLKPGRVYRVVEVRDKALPCKIHEEGVQVVMVKEPALEAAIESRLAFPLGIITFLPQECVEASCVNYGKCVPRGLRKEDRCKILEVRETVRCPLNRSLVLATLQRIVE